MNPLFIGRNVIKLDTVDSTNRYANDLLNCNFNDGSVKKIYDGTVVLARTQRSGKGRRGNNWESEPCKNLTFSIILYPGFLKASDQFRLNKVISLGIYDHVRSIIMQHDEKCDRTVSIKWPNDIYAGSDKISGILLENAIRQDKISHSIIGIGLNIKIGRAHV